MEQIKESRNDCMALDHASFDLVLMGQIMANTTDSKKAQHSRLEHERIKTSTKFYYHCIKVKLNYKSGSQTITW